MRNRCILISNELETTRARKIPRVESEEGAQPAIEKDRIERREFVILTEKGEAPHRLATGRLMVREGYVGHCVGIRPFAAPAVVRNDLCRSQELHTLSGPASQKRVKVKTRERRVNNAESSVRVLDEVREQSHA